MALIQKDDLERAERGMADLGVVLERGESFEGRLAFQDTARIEGRLTGRISSTGKLLVGPDAAVNGEVTVGSAWVAGALDGRITVQESLELTESARVSGTIKVGVLVSEKGAVVDAEVQICRPS